MGSLPVQNKKLDNLTIGQLITDCGHLVTKYSTDLNDLVWVGNLRMGLFKLPQTTQCFATVYKWGYKNGDYITYYYILTACRVVTSEKRYYKFETKTRRYHRYHKYH